MSVFLFLPNNAFSAVTQSVEFKQRVSRGSGIVELQTCPYGAETSAVQMLPVGCRQSRVDKKHSRKAVPLTPVHDIITMGSIRKEN